MFRMRNGTVDVHGQLNFVSHTEEESVFLRIPCAPRRPRLVCSSSSSTAGAIEGGLAGDSLSSGVQYGLSDGLGTTPLVFEPQVQLLSTDVLVGTSGASLTSEKTSA
eukprot:1194624-Prorocentrum_minimum.AAC.2